MFRKVLVMNKIVNGEKVMVGTLSLENDKKLLGKLRLFDLDGNTLVLKIGENSLVFDDIKDKNFEFETIYHDLSLPACAILTDGNKVCEFAKTEDCLTDEHELLKELESFDKSFGAKTQSLEEDQEKQEEQLNDNVDLKEKIENTDNFLEMIKPQLDVLFESNEPFKELEEMLEGTKWVKVFYAGENSDHYILGKIFDGDVVTYIAYGLPAKNKDELPPKGLEQFCQWLPLKPHDEQSAGYFVMYQDAITGENINF